MAWKCNYCGGIVENKKNTVQCNEINKDFTIGTETDNFTLKTTVACKSCGKSSNLPIEKAVECIATWVD